MKSMLDERNPFLYTLTEDGKVQTELYMPPECKERNIKIQTIQDFLCCMIYDANYWYKGRNPVIVEKERKPRKKKVITEQSSSLEKQYPGLTAEFDKFFKQH